MSYPSLVLRSTDSFVLGDLLLVDVENKDIAFSKKTESKVTSLVWVQQEKPRKKDTIDSVLVKVNENRGFFFSFFTMTFTCVT